MSKRATSLRSHSLSELSGVPAGTFVSLCGFSAGRLNDADPDFDLVDRFGACRVTVAPTTPQVRLAAKAIPRESALAVEGVVKGPTRDRPDVVEVVASRVTLLGASGGGAFDPRQRGGLGGISAAEKLRARHLTLREGGLMGRLKTRHALLQASRAFLSELDFMEVELPALTGWDPTEAESFIVPQAQYRAYGLNQTGQLYKQMLMLGGCDRIFSFTRCFRDEGAYGPFHQPEYTALDVEMSWVTEADVHRVVSGALDAALTEALGERPEIPRLSWDEALGRYGTERPDLRFGLPIQEMTELGRRSRSKILKELLDRGGDPGPSVHAIRIPRGDAAQWDDEVYGALTTLVDPFEGLQVSWLKVEETTRFAGPLAEAFDAHLAEDVCEALGANPGDVLALVLSPNKDAGLAVAGRARALLGERLGLIPKGAVAFAWVYDVPYFAYHLEANAYVRNRHLLTRPYDDDLPLIEDVLTVYRAEEAKEQARQKGQGFEDAPGRQMHRLIHFYGEPGLAQRLSLRSQGFELVLNGVEVGTGSIRNHDLAVQRKVMELLDGSADEIPAGLAPLFEALGDGAPPHGGISIGFDRLVTLVTGASELADAMAFPKDGQGRDPLSRAPSPVQAIHVAALLGTEPLPLSSTPTDEHFDPEYAGGLTTESVRAAFTFDPSPAVVGQPIQFIDRTESVVPVVDRIWSCPRIKWRSTLENPKKRFSAPGEYEVTLTVFLADGRKASARGKVLISRAQAGRGLR